MTRIGVLLAAMMSVGLPAGAAEAGCFPVQADVISLGEKPARFYAERSLDNNIEAEKRTIKSSGAEIGRIVKKELSCKPYPNLIGADEWRCTGEARVCSKS